MNRFAGVFLWFLVGCGGGEVSPTYEYVCEGYERDVCVALSYVAASEETIFTDALLGEFVWQKLSDPPVYVTEDLGEWPVREGRLPVVQPLLLRLELVDRPIRITVLAFKEGESVAEGVENFEVASAEDDVFVTVEMRRTK